jgi:mono/diheme cytochrome c family protein
MTQHERSLRCLRPATLAGLLFLVIGLVVTAATSLEAQSNGDWVVPARRAAQANPLQATADHIAQGRTLYMRGCAFCHGETGNNEPERAPREMVNSRTMTDLTLQAESDGALFWKIAEGRRPMPSSMDVLNDRERWQIVLYLRSLAPQLAGPETSEGR